MAGFNMSTPTLEEVEVFEKLAQISKVLDENSGFVEQSLQEAEDELKASQFPISAEVELFRRDLSHTNIVEVTYFRYDVSWRKFCIQKKSYTTDSNELSTEGPSKKNLEEWTRQDRVAAMRKLPELLEKLRKAGEDKIEKLCVPPN